MVKATFFALMILALVCVLLFGATTMTNGGVVYKAFATHPDVPPSGGLLVWAKTDGTMQTTNSSATDAPMGGGTSGPSLFRPPVAVDNTTGWTDYGTTTGRTIDTSNAGIVIISAVSGTGKNLQGRKMAVTPPFDKIFAIMPLFGSDAGTTSDFSTGGVFASDAAGKSVTCALEVYHPAGGTFFQHVNNDTPAGTALKLTEPRSVSFQTVNPPFNDLATVRYFPLKTVLGLSYFRLKDVSSTLSCQWSPDGYSWLTVWSTADNAFLSAPSAVGYFVDAGTATLTTPLHMIVRGVE